MHHSSLLQNAYVHKPRLHPEPRQSYINGTAISSTVGHLHASPWFKNTSAFLPSPFIPGRALLPVPSSFSTFLGAPSSLLPSPSRGQDPKQASEAVSSLFRGRWKERVRVVQVVYTRERSYEFVNKSRGIIEIFISQSLFLFGGSESGVDCRCAQ